jgi:putative chitinase
VVWYWTVARPGINAQSDARDIVGVTRAINGGTHGLQDRTERWNRCLAMGDRLVSLTAGAPTAPAPPVAPEEDWLMSTEGITLLREAVGLLRSMADDQTSSISPFRHLGSEQAGSVTMPRRVDFIDANLHQVYVLMMASIGDPDHLALLAEVAGALNDPRYPDRQGDAARAARVLQWAKTQGFEVPDTPPPPTFVCEITGSADCIGGGADSCSLTTSGRCIRSEYGQITMGAT